MTITMAECSEFLIVPDLSVVSMDVRLLRISGSPYSLPSFFTSDVLNGVTDYPSNTCGDPGLVITGTGSNISTATAVASGAISMNTISFQVDSASADAAATTYSVTLTCTLSVDTQATKWVTVNFEIIDCLATYYSV